MRFILHILIISLLVANAALARVVVRRVTLSGYVREAGSQESLIGVNVYIPGTSVGTTTNTYGFYSITLPAQDSLDIVFSFVGYEKSAHRVGLQTSATLNVSLMPGHELAEVGVRAGQRVSESSQMSRIDLPTAQLKKIPAFLGEKDVLKVLQLMPGVQKGSEGQTGIYVRGGGPDQNLITIDDAVVYNATHLFGFFSVFNGDALKSVELTKGGFPARYGGRLSSVIELNMKDGNREKLHGEGGIGLIASRLLLEGPLVKKKAGKQRSSSFLISGRRTYLDVVGAPLLNAQSSSGTRVGYYFYDLNAKVNYEFGPKDKLYATGYFGRDRYYTRNESERTNVGLGWGNAAASLRWNHLFSQKVFANVSVNYSEYDLRITSDETNMLGEDSFSLRYNSGIRDLSLKADVDYYPSPQHALRIGFLSTYHRFTPSAVVTKNDTREPQRLAANVIDAVESGIYVDDNWRLGERWRINGGVRVSQFRQQEVSYLQPEPRLSAAYILKPNFSIKASYALMNQYVHMLSNTGAGLPTDLWVPTTKRVRPQQSQQVAVGFAKEFLNEGDPNHDLILTVEAYYKPMRNIISYKEGASFLLSSDSASAGGAVRWEDNVTSGRGWSYGTEFLLQKKAGRFSGWVGYTLSWTRWQFPEINGGRPYYPRYDRRHDISLVGIYELNKRVTLSATWVYGTGNALTVPIGRYSSYQPGSIATASNSGLIQYLFQTSSRIQDYGTEKNSFRAEPYHRLDVGLQLRRQRKNSQRIWEFSLYNAYNRYNPFYYKLEPVSQPNGPSRVALFRYSVFPVVPSVSYTIKF